MYTLYVYLLGFNIFCRKCALEGSELMWQYTGMMAEVEARSPAVRSSPNAVISARCSKWHRWSCCELRRFGALAIGGTVSALHAVKIKARVLNRLGCSWWGLTHLSHPPQCSAGGRTVVNGNLLTLMRVFLCITSFASTISAFVVWGEAVTCPLWSSVGLHECWSEGWDASTRFAESGTFWTIRLS